MALFPLNIPPGIDTEHSPYDASPAWVDCDKVRFRAGRPESWKGWRKAFSTTLTGIARAALGWRALDNRDYIAFGTHLKLQIEAGGDIADITPVRASGTLGLNPITTTNGLTTVTIHSAGHGCVVGDIVIFAGAAAVHGITVSGEYYVTSVTDANNFIITTSQTANANGAGGGAAVTYTYLLHVGAPYAYAGLGWGAGRFGVSTWGTPRTTSNTTIALRTWSLDNWGENLVANPAGDTIYAWARSSGTTTRATAISGAPLCNSILVSPTDRTLIAFGSDAGTGTIDPMLISWSDQEDYTTWDAAPDNSAGTYRLTEGSKIVAAVRTRNIILVFTDRAVYGMQFTGAPFTFSFSLLATGCGLVGPHAAVELAGNVYWMGRSCKNLFVYNGGIQSITCPVLNYIQNNIDSSQNDQVYAHLNKLNHEVTWLWCSTNGNRKIDRYTTFNYQDNVWYHGSIDRSVWLPAGTAGLANPIAVDFSGQIYYQDTGNDADQAPLLCWVQSSAMEIGQGDHFMFINRVVPDFQTLSGEIDIELLTYRYPNDASEVKGSFSLAAPTDSLWVRARGRQFEVYLTSYATNAFWRLGKFRVDGQPDGRRG